MKKILAILLAAMMLVSLAACGEDEPKIPGGDTAADTAGGEGDTAGETEGETEPVETEPEEVVYEPDFDAKYGGMVGMSVEAGEAWFDNIKVTSKQSNKLQLLNCDMEDGNAPEFVYTAGDAISVATDPLASEDDDEIGKVLAGAAGSVAYTGDGDWNYYQYAVKVLPADNDTIINIMFCIKDENNYYMLTLGEDGNTLCDCYEVKDGVKTSIAAKVFDTLPLDTWSTIGVTVEREIIDVYINGEKRFSLFNEDFTYSVSIAPTATIDAPYCASWESSAILNDGQWNDTTYLASSGGTAYGSWSMSGTTETITYNWEEAVTVDGIGMFFWRDAADRATWLANGGICPPASYTIQYLNDAGEYVDVTGVVGGEVEEDVMNQTFFDEITTTSLQFTLIKFTEDEDAQYGFSTYADYTGDGTEEGAPQDPSTRGMGLFEIEVYEAGSVERPE